MAVAGVLLLPWGYMGSVATLIFLLNAGIVPLNGVTQRPVEIYITPLWWYFDSGWPGGKACHDLIAFSKKAGQRTQGL